MNIKLGRPNLQEVPESLLPGAGLLGRPNLQKLVETLLLRARLRVFSKLFLDLAFFFRSKIV